MAAAVCPHCQAYTSTHTGHCDVCKRPLQGAPIVRANPPTPAGPYTTYGLPPPIYGPPPGAFPSPYGPAFGPPPGYAPVYPPMLAPPPGFVVPVPYVKQAAFLAREAFGARFGAAVLDAFIVVGVWVVLLLFVYPSFTSGPGAFAIRIPITVTWALCYYGFQDGKLGGTIGKMAVGLRVVDEHFQPITLGKGFARALEILLWPLLAGLVLFLIQWVLIDKNGQGIGDRLANCFVIDKAHLGSR